MEPSGVFICRQFFISGGSEMGTDLTIRQNDLDQLWQLGSILAQSGMFQDAKMEAQAVVKVLAGRELGFGAIASMTGVNVIKGRVGLSANLMAAAVKRSGKYTYRVRVMDNTLCEIEFFERVDGKWESIGVSPFTLEDAKKAGTQNLDKFPRNMLFARALSNGVRWFCPDVTGGPVYTPEELGAEVDDEGEVVGPLVTIESPSPVEEVQQEDAELSEARASYSRIARQAVAAGLPKVAGLKRSDDLGNVYDKTDALIERIKYQGAVLYEQVIDVPEAALPDENDPVDVWLEAIADWQAIIRAAAKAAEVQP
jgi:hypothetical protein